MNYYYNEYGWYTSVETETFTEIEPTNTSETEVFGEMRSQFNGLEWIDTPYYFPIYYYDEYGWLSLTPIDGRSTSVIPPNVSETEVVGELRPNFTGYTWIELPYAEPPVPPVPETPTLPNNITLLALNLRMTRPERDAVRAAQLSDPDVSDVMFLMSQATYIDLDRPETIGSLQMLEAKGLLGVGRANEILTDPIQSIERPITRSIA